MGRFRRTLYLVVAVSFLSAVAYMAYYMIAGIAPLFPVDEVTEITEWIYEDEQTGPRNVTTPTRVDKRNRDIFIYRSVMPDSIPDGAVIAFLLRSNFTIRIGDRVAKEWNKDEAPIIGGPAKNSYFIIDLEEGDAGQDISVTIKDSGYGGSMYSPVLGNKYDVIRHLEIENGAFQFILSLALLISSFVIVIVGLAFRVIYKFEVKLTKMAIGVLIASSWMVTDSFIFQFLFRTQFIDGFMSYMCTLCMTLPFIGYLDAIQDYRYEKFYIPISAFETFNLVLFTCLHISRALNFSKGLKYLDMNIGIGILICFAITVYDIAKGYASKYKLVAYGFLIFMTLSIIEILLINLAIVRVEGGMIVAGLFILFAFAIGQQVTEIRKVQVDRDRANEEGAMKTKFLTSMSHEIRTPINAILGMNEMIIKESRDPAITAYADMINDSGNLLLSIVNDILDVSRIGNDTEKIICENYNPEKLFENAKEMLVTLAGKKGLEIKTGKPRNLPPILYGDEKKILQILVNLITNAVKYTETGTVTFTGDCFDTEDGYELCFYVSDTGIGIRREELDSIFDPFHRVEHKKTQSVQGSGLGLSIVKGLAEKMGGSVNVESTYGKGSTFSVRIPQLSEVKSGKARFNTGVYSEEDPLDDIDPNYIAPEARILEVDDNTSNQVVVRQFLKETGAILDVASGGNEALRLCRVNKYDVILMDHMMPDPDGIETMHMIRTTEGSLNVSTPEIILTANAIMGSRAKYEAEGFDNYLSKPVESERLLKMVRKYLPEDKVMYKPKKRTYAQSPQQASQPLPPANVKADQAGAVSDDNGPIDFKVFMARVDNNKETVTLILEEVVKESAIKIPMLRELLAGGDIKRYAIEAHGVKGSMAGIAANSLSEHAKKHELAAKGGDSDFIKGDIDDFIREYESVIEYIKQYLNNHQK